MPIPSVADLGYLAFYPLAFCGIVSLMRSRIPAASRMVWVDGITAALAIGALSAALVVEAVLGVVEGQTLETVTNLAYPVGDLFLMGLVVAAVALRGWQVDRTWALLGTGIVLFWIADGEYLIESANGTYANPNLVDMVWVVAFILLAAAAWQPARIATAVERRPDRRQIFAPVFFAVVSLGVLVVAAAGSVNPLAVVLAGTSLLAVMTRLVLTFRENAAMLEASRVEALTDDLTGLGNRRALTMALQRALGEGEPAEPLVLALFDLDGFKHYNDSFGHPSGDELLSRLGRRLARTRRRARPGVPHGRRRVLRAASPRACRRAR